MKITNFDWKPIFQPLFGRVYVNLLEGIMICPVQPYPCGFEEANLT